MNIQPIFPVELFWWKWDGDMEDILYKAKKLKQGNFGQSVPDLHNNEEFEELFKFFHKCLGEVKNFYDLQCDELRIVSAWMNKYVTNTGQDFHQHPMSAFSGCFYLTDGAPITFKDPISVRQNETTIPIGRQNVDRRADFPAVKGNLMIFPHWLEHGLWNGLPEDRWSLAFNSLPNGRINCDSNCVSSAAWDLRHSFV